MQRKGLSLGASYREIEPRRESNNNSNREVGKFDHLPNVKLDQSEFEEIVKSGPSMELIKESKDRNFKDSSKMSPSGSIMVAKGTPQPPPTPKSSNPSSIVQLQQLQFLKYGESVSPCAKPRGSSFSRLKPRQSNPVSFRITPISQNKSHKRLGAMTRRHACGLTANPFEASKFPTSVSTKKVTNNYNNVKLP